MSILSSILELVSPIVLTVNETFAQIRTLDETAHRQLQYLYIAQEVYLRHVKDSNFVEHIKSMSRRDLEERNEFRRPIKLSQIESILKSLFSYSPSVKYRLVTWRKLCAPDASDESPQDETDIIEGVSKKSSKKRRLNEKSKASKSAKFEVQVEAETEADPLPENNEPSTLENNPPDDAEALPSSSSCALNALISSYSGPPSSPSLKRRASPTNSPSHSRSHSPTNVSLIAVDADPIRAEAEVSTSLSASSSLVSTTASRLLNPDSVLHYVFPEMLVEGFLVAFLDAEGSDPLCIKQLLTTDSMELRKQIDVLHEESLLVHSKKLESCQSCYDQADKMIQNLDKQVKKFEDLFRLAVGFSNTSEEERLCDTSQQRKLLMALQRRNVDVVESSAKLSKKQSSSVDEESETKSNRKVKEKKVLVEEEESCVDIVGKPEEFDVPADPNEPVYCFCRKVSYGEMVGCDNDDCPYEWFHFTCVSLTQAPSTKWKWYCPECAPKFKATPLPPGKK